MVIIGFWLEGSRMFSYESASQTISIDHWKLRLKNTLSGKRKYSDGFRKGEVVIENKPGFRTRSSARFEKIMYKIHILMNEDHQQKIDELERLSSLFPSSALAVSHSITDMIQEQERAERTGLVRNVSSEEIKSKGVADLFLMTSEMSYIQNLQQSVKDFTHKF